MTATILQFPGTPAVCPSAGTVCVMPSEGGGFKVAHESASGNSSGAWSGPYVTGEAAIAAAHARNRDEYDGRCALSICEDARAPFQGEGF